MARPHAKGFPFFSLDSDIFFSERTIRGLIGRYGADGMVLYIFILCEVYRTQGYYAVYDRDFVDCAGATLNMSVDKIGQMMNYLFERSLLDRKLFESVKVLTSHGIQLRFQTMSKGRGTKNKILVDSRLWLLSQEETEGFISFTQNENCSQKKGSYSKKNHNCSENNPTKRKERKEKEKTKESNLPDSADDKKPYGELKNVYLTEKEYKDLKNKFPEDYQRRIDDMSFGISSKGYRYDNHFAAILLWANKEKKEVPVQGNYQATGYVPPSAPAKNRFHNFEQRESSPGEMDALYFLDMYGIDVNKE